MCRKTFESRCDIASHNGLKGHGEVTSHSPNDGQKTDPALLVFSANDSELLEGIVKKVQEFYSNKHPSLNDLAYSLAVGKEHLPYRAFTIMDRPGPFVITGGKNRTPSQDAGPVFIFTGQGAQWPGMGKELMAAHDSFLKDIRRMDSHLAKLEEPPGFRMERK
jgi:acyl transferase domain-containing protein